MSADVDRISLATVALPANITHEIHDISARPAGYGGYSDIYTGIWRSVHGEMKVAIKVVRVIPGTDEIPRALRREISVWKRLQHRNIHVMCGLYEGYGPAPALVSPWYEHGNVKGYLRRHVNDPDVDLLKLRLLCDIMCGVTFLHSSSIVHGDIKGDNVLISDEGVARLCDFGLSRLLIEHSQSITHTSVRGTSRWMAPEVFLEGEQPSYASDVWAYGCLVIEVWLDVRPYQTILNDRQLSIALSEEESPCHSQSDMPETAWTVVQTCCNFDAAQRPSPLLVGTHFSIHLTILRVHRMVTFGLPIDSGGSEILRALEESLRALDPQQMSEFYILTENELAAEVIRLIAHWSIFQRSSPLCSPAVFRWCIAKVGIGNLNLPARVSLPSADGDDFARECGQYCDPAVLRLLARVVERARPALAKDLMTQFATAALGSPLNSGTRARSVAWLSDSRRIVVGCGDAAISILDVATGATLLRLVGHAREVNVVAVSPKGKLLASCSYDTRIRLWDAQTAHAIGAPMVGHTDWVTSLAFSPDGRHIISGSFDDTIRVWNIDTRKTTLGPLRVHAGVWSVAYSPDGSRLISGSGNTVRVWDARTGDQILTLRGHTDWVRSVAYSPDGLRIVSGSDDCTVRIWDATQGHLVDIALGGHSSCIWSVAYSPDGTRIASGSNDHSIRIWHATTGAFIAALRGHTNCIYSLAFSPDGKRLASASGDGTVRIWDGTEEWMRWDI